MLRKEKNFNFENSALAKGKAIKGSVQKVNLVARLIVGLKADVALLQLRFSKKAAARDLYAILNSAISNAQNNNGLDVDSLYVSKINVGKAFTLRRFAARARGRASRINKYYSQVTIFVSERGN
jgi:large subunit ribosomal protein L22